jgi:uncharacterized protein YegL
MKENLTEIVFIIDRSGSMANLTNDTIGGFNTFIENQKKEAGEAVLTTILFDDKYEILHDGVDIKKVNPLTDKEYFARGMTALLDAIGKTINTIGERLNKTEEVERPSKVIFVITTDGAENSSSEFTKPQIKEMIEHQTNKYNWQFMFLGANIDAVGTAQSFGISGQFASNYTASSVGTDALYTTLSKSVASYRSVGEVSDNWKDELK